MAAQRLEYGGKCCYLRFMFVPSHFVTADIRWRALHPLRLQLIGLPTAAGVTELNNPELNLCRSNITLLVSKVQKLKLSLNEFWLHIHIQ